MFYSYSICECVCLFVLIETTTTAFLTYRKVYAPCPSLWCELFKYKLYVGIVVVAVDTHIAHNLHIIPYGIAYLYIVYLHILYIKHMRTRREGARVKAIIWRLWRATTGQARARFVEWQMHNTSARACLCITCGNAVDRNPKYIVYICIYATPPQALVRYRYSTHERHLRVWFCCVGFGRVHSRNLVLGVQGLLALAQKLHERT